MCYRDKTWCVHSNLCSNATCNRNLNEKEIKLATAWWGGDDFPYAIADFKTDKCGYAEINQKELTNGKL